MNKNLGLVPKKKDRRDYSFHKNFGSAPLDGLPSQYTLPTNVLDQNGYNQCTAYSACAVKESKFGVPFDTQDFFNQEGVQNGSVNLQGYDLRILFDVGRKYGAKPLSGGDPAPYKDGGYFWIHGPYDTYDSIRSALWINKDEKRAIVAGLTWYDSWTHALNGVVGTGIDPIGLHAVKVAGWTDKALFTPLAFSEPRLAVQNSFGAQYGDQGWFYFTRAQVNQYFTEGQGMWADTPQGLSFKTISALQDLLNRMKQVLLSLLAKLQQ